MYPKFLYEVYATIGGVKDHEELHIATFFDVMAAQQFCDTENAEMGCNQLSFESLPLIDAYGFHCQPKDLF